MLLQSARRRALAGQEGKCKRHIYYTGWGVLAEGIEKYRVRKGKWPEKYSQVFEAGLLPEDYSHVGLSDSDRIIRKRQKINADFATIKIAKKDKYSVRYKLIILGYDLGEMGTTVSKPGELGYLPGETGYQGK